MWQTLGAVIAGLPADFETWSSVGANAAQMVALAVAGWWTYSRFIKQRQPFPRATVELVIAHRQLAAEHTFLRVVAKVTNVGNALLETELLRADVSQVLPVAPETAAKLAEGSLVPEGDREAAWLFLDSRTGGWPCHIEPGEWDEFGFDFVIPADVTVVFIYTYIKNVTQKKRDIGWTVTKLYDLDDDRGEKRELSESGFRANER
jgi:hypothetical protein